MSEPRRLVTAERRDDDSESSLRPLSLADFTGQVVNIMRDYTKYGGK